MFSLTDIIAMNARAAAGSSKLKRAASSKRKPKCGYWNCNSRASRSHLVYDIFSEDPKDVIDLCESHDGFTGDRRIRRCCILTCLEVAQERHAVFGGVERANGGQHEH